MRTVIFYASMHSELIEIRNRYEEVKIHTPNILFRVILCSTHRCGKLNEHQKDEYEKRSCVLVTTSNVTDTMQTERKYKYIIILQSVQSTMEHKTS